MRAAVVVIALALTATARADEPKPIVGARVEGASKTTAETALRLARVSHGDAVTTAMLPDLEAALLSSGLFKTVKVRLEDAPGGAVLVATLDDKHSWAAAPTVYLLPDNYSFGVGFVENNLLGEDKKLLLYGQYGNVSSLFFGTYLDPAFRGTKLQLRFDVYFVHENLLEYENDPDRPTDYTVARQTTWTFADIGILLGWRFRWWLVGDVRLKPAYSHFSSPTTGTYPERDGWDNTVQTRLTIDRRHHRYGVSWGPYVQLITDVSVPLVDDYQYQLAAARAYYSWRLFPEASDARGFWQRLGREHQLEFRTSLGIGRHLPIHEELTLGGVKDLRGYKVAQFRGDRRLFGRAEYSLQLAKWWVFTFRAIGFFDAGYVGFHWRDPSTRDYLPTQRDGAGWIRSNVGGGVRIYVGNIVLPLLGLDMAYGLEGKQRELYFQVGLTDF